MTALAAVATIADAVTNRRPLGNIDSTIPPEYEGSVSVIVANPRRREYAYLPISRVPIAILRTITGGKWRCTDELLIRVKQERIDNFVHYKYSQFIAELQLTDKL